MTNETDSLESRILRKVFLWMVTVGLGVGSVAGSGLLRVLDDKFGYQDFELEREKMMREVKLELEYCKHNIERRMPGLSTRKRIKALERAMEKTDPNFEPATQEWQ